MSAKLNCNAAIMSIFAVIISLMIGIFWLPEPIVGPQSAADRSYGAMSFSPDGALLVGISDRDIVIWRAKNLALVRTLSMPCGLPEDIAWSADGRYLATSVRGSFGGVRQQVMVWRTDRWQPVAIYQANGFLKLMQFLPKSPEMLIGTNDRKLVRWSFARNRTVQSYNPNKLDNMPFKMLADPALPKGIDWSALAVSPSGKMLACVDAQRHGPFLKPASMPLTPPAPFRALPWYPPITEFYADTPSLVGRWSTIEPNAAAMPAVAQSEGLQHTEWQGRDGDSRSAVARLVKLSPSIEAADITVTIITGGQSRKRNFRIANGASHLQFSPNGRYLSYAAGSFFDVLETIPIHLIDLQTNRISPLVAHDCYDPAIFWSPDSRFLTLYDHGLTFTKYSTQHTLLCWDLQRSNVRAVITAWTIDASWTSQDRLIIKTGGNCVSEFDPLKGKITFHEQNGS